MWAIPESTAAAEYRREDVYRRAYEQLEAERRNDRRELVELRARVISLAGDRDTWRELALKYGAATSIEFGDGSLEGRVQIAPEIARQGSESIAMVCLDLARKLSNAVIGR